MDRIFIDQIAALVLAWVPTGLVWVLIGPLFGYSDTWQLVVNTTTTIIAPLVVFLIQVLSGFSCGTALVS